MPLHTMLPAKMSHIQLCNTAEGACTRKHSRKPRSIMTFNHSALRSPELALFEVKYAWHKKPTLGTSFSSSTGNCEFPAARAKQQGHCRNSYLAASENTTPLSRTHWHTSALNTNAIQNQNSSDTSQHNETLQLLTWHRPIQSMSAYQTTLESH